MSLNDFEVIKPLGKGAFASVYQVKRKKDSKIYAMKRVNFGTMNSKEKDNAVNEIRILASVQHNNIIGYKESFYDDNSKTLNIIMDFADEGDLDGKLKKQIESRTNFPENEIWSYLIQILQGLRALHNAKIMHRDLKSANIFLKQGIIKLGDLNVSKLIKRLGMDHTQTGTPYYASPEVWSDKPYDYKCDIWSVGCIIYELCALKPPFRANSLEDLFKAITKGKYDPIPSIYSKELSMMIGILLQVNPSLRPDVHKLLSNQLILKKMDFSQNIDNSDQGDGTNMLKTIKVPKNLKEINQQLPKQKNYDIGEVIIERKNSEEDLKRQKEIRTNIMNPYSKIGENIGGQQPQYKIGGGGIGINNPTNIIGGVKNLDISKPPSDNRLNPVISNINNPIQNPSSINQNPSNIINNPSNIYGGGLDKNVQNPYSNINRPNPSIINHNPSQIRPIINNPSNIGQNKQEINNVKGIQDQRAELLKKYNNPISNNNPYSNIQKNNDVRIRPRTPDAPPKNNVIMKHNNINIQNNQNNKIGVINPNYVLGNKGPLNNENNNVLKK